MLIESEIINVVTKIFPKDGEAIAIKNKLQKFKGVLPCSKN